MSIPSTIPNNQPFVIIYKLEENAYLISLDQNVYNLLHILKIFLLFKIFSKKSVAFFICPRHDSNRQIGQPQCAIPFKQTRYSLLYGKAAQSDLQLITTNIWFLIQFPQTVPNAAHQSTWYQV